MKTYNEFRSEYEEQHPSSVPQREIVVSPYPRWLVWVVLAMFVASVLLSGVHTVPTVYDTIPTPDTLFSEDIRKAAAYSSIVIIELGLFVSVYASLSSKSMVPRIIQIVAFVAAIAANLYSVLKTLGETNAATANPDAGTVAVGIVVGFVAPLVALLSGEMYIKMHSADRRGKLDADTRYREARQVFDAQVLDAYDAYRIEWQRVEDARLAAEADQRRKDEERERRATARRTSASTTRSSASVRTDRVADADTDTSADGRADTAGGRGHATGQGYSKNMDARDQMRAHLQTNKHLRSKSARWLAENVGIGGKTVWAEIKAEFGGADADIEEPIRMDDATVNELLSLNEAADAKESH